MLDDTYAHTPLQKMFDQADVYGIGYDEERANPPRVRLGIIDAAGVAQSKYFPVINRLRTIWEPVEVPGIAEIKPQALRCLRFHRSSHPAPIHRPVVTAVFSVEEVERAVITEPEEIHKSSTSTDYFEMVTPGQNIKGNVIIILAG